MSDNDVVMLSSSESTNSGDSCACGNPLRDHEERPLQASCRCGYARHDLGADCPGLFPLKAAICHCNSCRHTTGLLGFAAASVAPGLEPTARWLDKLTAFEFSENITHFFCPYCGTGLVSECTGKGGSKQWLVHLGTLGPGDTTAYRIDAHIFVEVTLDGGLADILTEVDGHRIERRAQSWNSEELPLGWKAPNRPQVKPPLPDDRLHGYCKCRGVEFWLAPPCASSSAELYGKESFPEDRYISRNDEVFWITDNKTKYQAAFCPCDSCRLAGGQPFAQWAYVPTDAISLDPAGKRRMPKNLQWGTLKSYHTANASCHFCGRCGAIIFWNTYNRPYLKDFGIGLFDSPDGARAESWFHWPTKELRHREDGLKRAPELTLAVEKGLKEYGEKVQGKIA